MPPARFAAGVLTLRLHVQPGAHATGWAGRHGEHALKLRLAAPAVDGRANAACIAFLAQAADVPRRAVQITQGELSREKVVTIQGITPSRFQALEAQWSL
ncbi:MAG TPA: DUF167 domain-containing protein [bacterium]